MSDTSSVYGKHDDDLTTSDQTLVAILGDVLALLVVPTVIGPPLVLGATVVTDINIRAWEPFEKASTAWNDISDFFTSVNANASQLAGEVQQTWRSTGADAFEGFMKQIDKQLAAIAAAAQGCRDMCDDMRWGLITNLATFAGATVAAIIGAALAYAAGEAAPALQLALLGGWVGFIVTLLAGLVSLTQQIFTASKDISDAWSDLTDVFTTKAGKIQTDSLAPLALTSKKINAPRAWVKQPED